MQAWKILVIGSYDSFLKAGSRLAQRFERRGARVDTCILTARKGQLSQRQLSELGLPADARFLPMDQMVTRAALAPYDIVIVALAGEPSSTFYSRFAKLWRNAPARPLTISLYPGIVFRFHYEGMLRRMGADLVLLNSPHDLEMYQQLCDAAGLARCNGLVGGLAVLPGERQSERRAPERECFLFVGQPSVPAPRDERAHLMRLLADVARRYPRAEILVKPRNRPGETTLHKTQHQLSELLSEMANPPANLRLTYEPLDALWDRTSFCSSVSSTAVLEAVWRGIPSHVVADLGVHENLGNHFFLGSGLIQNLAKFTMNSPTALDAGWASRHLCGMDAQLDGIAAWIEERLAVQAAQGTALEPAPRGYFTYAPEELPRPRRVRWWRWARRAVLGNV